MKKWTFCLLLLFLPAGCGSPAHLESCRDKAEQFMERLAKGDFNGAYELCDPDMIGPDGLRKIANSDKNRPVLDDYKGLEHGEGGQETRDANDEIVEIRLAPVKFKGHDGFVGHFAFRLESGAWKITGFQIDAPK
jgi:hypothetical protein